MALQIWLPLTGDTHNQGLHDCGVINYGATMITTDGILGGCCQFNPENPSAMTKYMELDACMEDFLPDGGDFSMAVWYKLPSSYGPLHTSDAMGFGFISTSDYRKSGLTIGVRVNGSLYVEAFASGTAVDTTIVGNNQGYDKWNHYCVTYSKDAGRLTAYVNGYTSSYWEANLAEWANYAGRKVRIGRSTQGGWEDTFPGCLSDVRIYDHCLSKKEVRELAKGLAAHYKFTDSAESYINLLDGTTDDVYNNYTETTTTSATFTGEMYDGRPVRRMTITTQSNTPDDFFTNGTWGKGKRANRRTFLANTQYVYWTYYKVVSPQGIEIGGTASNIGGWTEIPPQPVGGGWYRVGQYRNGSVTTDKVDHVFTSFACNGAVAKGDSVIIDWGGSYLLEGRTDIPENYVNNGNLEPTTNLATNSTMYNSVTTGYTYNATGWGGDAGTMVFYRSGGYNNGPQRIVHKTATGSGGLYDPITADINIESGKTYTMSIYVKASRELTDSKYSFNINRQTDNNYITYGKNVTFTTEWKRLTKTFTATAAQAGMYREMSIVYNDDVADYYVYYSCFQIEEKDHATPFVYGTRGGWAISDSSGYEKHGFHESGSVTSVVTDGGRYGVALKNTDGYIGYAEVNMPALSAVTFSWWGKYDEVGFQGSGFFATSNRPPSEGPTDHDSTACNMYDWMFVLSDTSGGYVFIQDVSSLANYSTWNHFCVRYDGSTADFFVNGVKKKGNTHTKALNPFKYVYFGYSRAGWVTRMCKCSMSDFRIYSTALSNDDILTLYNTPASIDNKGNFDTFEVIEDKTERIDVDLSNISQISATGWASPSAPYFDKLDGSLMLNSYNGWRSYAWDTSVFSGEKICIDFDYMLTDTANLGNGFIGVSPKSSNGYINQDDGTYLDTSETFVWKHCSYEATADAYLVINLRGIDNVGDFLRAKIKNMTIIKKPTGGKAASIKKNGTTLSPSFKEPPQTIPALSLPVGSYVITHVIYAAGDECKAVTTIRYDKHGSGRDLMGYSPDGDGYWGVRADGTWEPHGTFNYTSADITERNVITYVFSSATENGQYEVGALIHNYMSRGKRIYNVKLYRNGTLERDYYPAIGANGNPGLIDVKTGTFVAATGPSEIKYDVTPEAKAKVFKTHIRANQIIEL